MEQNVHSSRGGDRGNNENWYKYIQKLQELIDNKERIDHAEFHTLEQTQYDGKWLIITSKNN